MSKRGRKNTGLEREERRTKREEGGGGGGRESRSVHVARVAACRLATWGCLSHAV